jgi:hypothetical protein
MVGAWHMLTCLPYAASEKSATAVPHSMPLRCRLSALSAYTTGQRNIFHQPWQRRTDLSVIKMTQFTERVGTRFTFELFTPAKRSACGCAESLFASPPPAKSGLCPSRVCPLELNRIIIQITLGSP